MKKIDKISYLFGNSKRNLYICVLVSIKLNLYHNEDAIMPKTGGSTSH